MVADTATSLRRGIAVLTALHGDEALAAGGLGVLRLAELIGQDKSQVSRTLKTLAEYGLVDRDPATRGYRLGWALFALAARAGDTRLLAAGEQVVEELVQQLGERVHLTVLQGSEVLTVLSDSPPHSIQATGWVGLTVPAYCASAGHALLADHSLPELKAMFGRRKFTQFAPNTVRSVAELHARIEQARERGFACVDEEFEPGLVAVAAPVRDFRGPIVAALNVSAPKFRFADRLDAAGATVAEAAEHLSGLLGWRPERAIALNERDEH